MNSASIVCIGDTHIENTKRLIPALGKHWFEPVEKVFNDVIAYCKTHTIQTIIFLGDIFDNPTPQQNSQLKFFKLLKSEPTFKFYCIEGNHDFSSYKETATEILEFLTKTNPRYKHVTIIRREPQIIPIDGVPFCFLPWPHTLSPFTDYPKINIAHLELQDAKYDNGMLIKNGVVLPENKDYWIIGHIHTYQEFEQAIYVGSPLQHNFGERPDRSFSHFTITQNKKKLIVDHQRVALTSYYTLHNVRVEKDDDLFAVTEQENQYFKLFIKRGYKLPDNYLKDHPQVLRTNGYRSKEELKALKKNNITIDIQPSFLFDATQNLEPYCHKYGLSDLEIRKAVNVTKDIMKELL